MSKLLHRAYLLHLPVMGKRFADLLTLRTQEVALATKDLPDPNISVVIRSQNKAHELEMLFKDILEQKYNGKVELILVDTESYDRTVEIAKKYGAKIVYIKQSEFSYPKALNLGFKSASHKWVFTFTDHGLLSNNQIFRIATRSENEKLIGGVSGLTFPNANASWTERIGTVLVFSGRLRKSAKPATKMFIGILPANASLINRLAWLKIGGFDESFGAGGEDSALAAILIKSGYTIVIDPAMSVHHSHGLSFIDSLRQFHYWLRLDKPRAFDLAKLRQFRKEYRRAKD